MWNSKEDRQEENEKATEMYFIYLSENIRFIIITVRADHHYLVFDGFLSVLNYIHEQISYEILSNSTYNLTAKKIGYKLYHFTI